MAWKYQHKQLPGDTKEFNVIVYKNDRNTNEELPLLTPTNSYPVKFPESGVPESSDKLRTTNCKRFYIIIQYNLWGHYEAKLPLATPELK